MGEEMPLDPLLPSMSACHQQHDAHDVRDCEDVCKDVYNQLCPRKLSTSQCYFHGDSDKDFFLQAWDSDMVLYQVILMLWNLGEF